MPDPDAARGALQSVDRERRRVIDHAVPRWLAPLMAVAFAAYFAVQDLAGTSVRHVMVFVFTLGYLGFMVGPLVRRRRNAQSRPHADPVPPEHHRRAQLAASVLLVLLLGGLLVIDHLAWPHDELGYGLVLGLVVLGGGRWLRHRLARQLGTPPPRS